ncbi:hypothetical protein AB60_2191 [Escherichia coli 2-156-04_S1_C3]|nr:hypothetical protein AB60_2191 [Escherichia coli 2-156-04_S1_C3]
MVCFKFWPSAFAKICLILQTNQAHPIDIKKMPIYAYSLSSTIGLLINIV